MNASLVDRPAPKDRSLPIEPADLRGLSRLAIDGVLGITGTVESMHQAVHAVGGAIGDARRERTGGLTGLVYGAVRGTTRVVGHGLDALLGALPLAPREPHARKLAREAFVAALNGVWGDHLHDSGNPLAIPMTLRVRGLVVDGQVAPPSRRIVVLVHGLAMSDLQWRRKGHDHGELLGHELGFTPVYAHYDSGRHVSESGRDLADALERLVAGWPVPVDDLVIVGHSMGGLVARSACLVGAAQVWRGKLSRIVFLGTPHHGAPLERVGRAVDTLLHASPYAAPIAKLARARSAGIADLQYGNVRDEDWQVPAATNASRHRDHRVPAPLPDGVTCYAVAATLSKHAEGGTRLRGDGLVPVPSALGDHADPARQLQIPAERRLVLTAADHWDLLDRGEVADALRRWLG
jgi:pimeloyl-ACP methyl ester carboxylesterase